MLSYIPVVPMQVKLKFYFGKPLIASGISDRVSIKQLIFSLIKHDQGDVFCFGQDSFF